MPQLLDEAVWCTYAHPLYQSWYIKATSHNTVAVNGAQPHMVLPTHIETTPSGVRAVIDGRWDGVICAARTLTAEGDGYEHFTDVRRVEGEALTLHAEKDGRTLTMTAPLDGMEAFLAKAPGNPVGQLRTAVILRCRDRLVRFAVKFTK